ncbi:hypothetical protein ACHAQH_005860 [Verticillium albo-atrum]
MGTYKSAFILSILAAATVQAGFWTPPKGNNPGLPPDCETTTFATLTVTSSEIAGPTAGPTGGPIPPFPEHSSAIEEPVYPQPSIVDPPSPYPSEQPGKPGKPEKPYKPGKPWDGEKPWKAGDKPLEHRNNRPGNNWRGDQV